MVDIETARADYETACDRLREAVAHLDNESMIYGPLSPSARLARGRVARFTDRRDYFLRVYVEASS